MSTPAEPETGIYFVFYDNKNIQILCSNGSLVCNHSVNISKVIIDNVS